MPDPACPTCKGTGWFTASAPIEDGYPCITCEEPRLDRFLAGEVAEVRQELGVRPPADRYGSG